MNVRMKKPDLPVEFYKKDVSGTIGLIGLMLLYFIGANLVNFYIWLGTELPLTAKILLSLPFFVLAGQGMHLMGWIGHDGLHFNLSKNRHISTILGIFFSAMTVVFIEMGMVLDHWTHHRFTNTEKDPDLKLFEKHRNFFARMLFTRMRANRLYLRRALRLALGMRLDKAVTQIVFPFSVGTLRAYARFNLLCVAFWGGVYLWIAQHDWRIGIITFVVPAVAANILSGLRSYIEHNGTDVEEFYNTRTRASWFWTFMDLGANYHLEHHLYPGVPQWKLRKVHQYLKQQGCYNEHCHIDETILGNYRYAFSNFTYPTASGADGKAVPEIAMY